MHVAQSMKIDRAMDSSSITLKYFSFPRGCYTQYVVQQTASQEKFKKTNQRIKSSSPSSYQTLVYLNLTTKLKQMTT